MSDTVRGHSSEADLSTTWTVEEVRPSDRGLIARLLEDLVNDDPTVAPEVATKEVRAAQWLQKHRGYWSGIVVQEDGPTRTIIGYGTVSLDSSGAPSSPLVLVAPGPQADKVRQAIESAASAARPSPPPMDNEEELAITYALPSPPSKTMRSWPGALAIAGAGALAVVSLQVGFGPLGAGLPFFNPDPPGVSVAELSEDEPILVPDEGPAVQSEVSTEPIEVMPPSPLPPAPTGPGVPSNSPEQGGQEPDPPPPTPPSVDPLPDLPPAPASDLLRPLTDAVDERVGTDLSPLVERVERVEKDLNRTVKEVVDEVPIDLPVPLLEAKRVFP